MIRYRPASGMPRAVVAAKVSPGGPAAAQDDAERQAGQEQLWAAAEERAPGADGKDDKHLGRQRFDKPACLEQRLAGAEQLDQRVEGEEIEHRAHRPEDQHKVFDELHIPTRRLGRVFRVDVVERDRDLRHVVEQVVEQHLDRQHRQERQEQGGTGHAEHVPEIRARTHQYVF